MVTFAVDRASSNWDKEKAFRPAAGIKAELVRVKKLQHANEAKLRGTFKNMFK